MDDKTTKYAICFPEGTWRGMLLLTVHMYIGKGSRFSQSEETLSFLGGIVASFGTLKAVLGKSTRILISSLLPKCYELSEDGPQHLKADSLSWGSLFQLT